MSLKHLILGCLMDRPAYGYEMLKSLYRDFFALSPEVNDGQLYTVLARMEKDGLITKEIVYQDKAPSKKLIHITPKGREEFNDWLLSGDGENEPVRFDFFNKYEFLNKCNFFNHASPETAREKLEKQIEHMENKLLSLQRARLSMVQKKVPPFRIKILDYGLEIQRVKIQWLKDMLGMFGGR
ncbi:transcriptional regulator [Desulfocucumis palustris]|uniref:Transcriptional regulator n=1 Tax=Desulfocucumis palustris TaxID=1898651 RepID=A0A2L2XEV5_9FIRM|nr:PadR family transcriptional regulator [Desulfocucumis palustris]GBF32351.1 transcriptional regulator [Desulfocucumis palustris]